MAKAINWNNFATQFGESFIRTLERERTLRQQQEEFNRRMQFENRQLTLYTDIAKERNELERQEQGRLTEQSRSEFQNNYVPLSPKFDPTFGFKVGSGGFEAFQQAPAGSIESGKDIQGRFPTLGEGMKGFYANKSLLPEAPKTPEDLWEDITVGAIGTGEYEGRKVKIIRNKVTGEERQVPLYSEPKNNKGGDGDGSDNYKEPKLTEAGAKGLAWLKSPNFTRASGKNVINLTKEEIGNKFSESLTSLAKDVLKSRTYKWFNTILEEYKKQGRIPTVAELDDRIVEHYEKYKTLNDRDVEELNVLMNYLSEADASIQSIYQKTK